MKQNQKQNPQKIFDGNEFNALKDFVKDAEKRGDIKKVSPTEIANLTKEVMRVDKPKSQVQSTSTANPNSNTYDIDSKVKLYEPKCESKTTSSSYVQQQAKQSSMSNSNSNSSNNKDDGQNEYYYSNSMKQKIEKDEKDILYRLGSNDHKEIYSFNPPKANTTSSNNNNQPQSKVEVNKPSTSTKTQPQNKQQDYSNDQKDWDGNINFGNLQDRQKMFEPMNDNQIKTPFPPNK